MRIMSLPGVSGRVLAPTKAMLRGERSGRKRSPSGHGVTTEDRLTELHAVPFGLVFRRVGSRLLLVEDEHLRDVLGRGDQELALLGRSLRGRIAEHRAVGPEIEKPRLRL